MNKGYFITFEGPDGSGKTTVANEIAKELIYKKYDVVLTREPGGIEIAEQIRKVILDTNNIKMDPKTEALLYAASRRQHLVEKVLPELKENKIVLCDRFIDSSLAYQGYARQLGIDNILKINEFAIESFMPDFTIYLDVDEKIALERIETRNEEKNRLDKESILFHHNVIEGYHEVIKMFNDRIKVVDASKKLDDVIADSLKIILNYIND